MDFNKMIKRPQNPHRFAFSLKLVLLAPFFFPLVALADTFNFVVGSSSPYAGVTYATVPTGPIVNYVTFSVQALNSGSLDVGFDNHPVTVGLFDTATGQFADPQGVYVQQGFAPTTGPTAPMTFRNGVLNFAVTLTSEIGRAHV